MKKEYIIQDKFAEIILDKEIYPLIAIKKALSNFFNNVYARIEEKNNKFIVNLKLQDENNNLEKIIGEFYNECLRESLRYEISIETKNLRELIVGRALYSTCIDLDESEDKKSPIEEKTDEYTEYSLEDIAVNWCKKYENSGAKTC